MQDHMTLTENGRPSLGTGKDQPGDQDVGYSLGASDDGKLAPQDVLLRLVEYEDLALEQ